MRELITLSDTPVPAGQLQRKYAALLKTPFLGVHSGPSEPKKPSVSGMGPVLRVAAWNIGTGAAFHPIRLAFADPARFRQQVAEQNSAVPEGERSDPKDMAFARTEADHLSGSDVIILNEVDLGMPRSGYRDVARELAEAVGMHYAFGVEFIEVDKIHLGIEPFPDVQEDGKNQRLVRRRATGRTDRSRYRGLQGTAVLSRYPIRSAKNVRLKPCYDWYGEERHSIDNLVENGRRYTAAQVFLERISREVRHGNRFALIVELDVPESPTGRVTVVAPHLENKSRPGCRREQMSEVLEYLRTVRNPVILGGDLNTSGTDATPTSLTRELVKRARNPTFWAGQAVQWFAPIPFVNLIASGTRYWRNYRDPTARHIPLLAPNGDARLLDEIEDFRFADDGRFDFSGDEQRSANGRAGTLANSNERARKGFRPTYEFRRDYKGLAGQMRLDWLLIKPSVAADGRIAGSFQPWHGRTLEHLNEAMPGRISDHHPITVDLALLAPGRFLLSIPKKELAACASVT